MSKTWTCGRHNAISDVPGIRVGHFSQGATGTTVVLVPAPGAVCGVDVRGSAPATRETDLLDPCNLVQRVHAVVLSGGSVFGLAAADGVVRYLEERGVGLKVEGDHVVPIVPAAALYDLGRGGDWASRPTAEFGHQACLAARSGAVLQGNVGAGTGALAGGLKGGIGTASVALEGGVIVGAVLAVNAFGSAVDASTGALYAAPLGLAGEFDPLNPRPVATIPPPVSGHPRGHTTLGVVATNAQLDKAQATKVAQMAHDGLARALRPVHTPFDGDTVFVLSTEEVAFHGKADEPFENRQATKVNTVGSAAADVVARAIAHAMLAARSALGAPCYRERFLSKR